MRWGKSTKERINKKEWHEWFAWHPVVVRSEDLDVDGKWVWWESIQRKQSRYFSDLYDYRIPKSPK